MNPEKFSLDSNEHIKREFRDNFGVNEKQNDTTSKDGGRIFDVKEEVDSSIMEKALNHEHVDPSFTEYFLKKEAKEKAKIENDIKEREENFNTYQKLLLKYKGVWGNIKQLERKHKNSLTDPEVSYTVLLLEEERHALHLEALEVANKIGKGKNEVLADILNKEGNLEEFGLPEFTLYEEGRSELDYEDRELSQGCSFLVFDVGNSCLGDQYMVRPEIPQLYDSVIYNRAGLLVKQFDLQFKDFPNNFSHSITSTIHSIEVPDDQLEKVASFIRSNPNQFRLKEEYFSDNEKQQAKIEYQKSLKVFIKYLDYSMNRSSTAGEDYDYLLEKVRLRGNHDEIEITESVIRDSWGQSLTDNQE